MRANQHKRKIIFDEEEDPLESPSSSEVVPQNSTNLFHQLIIIKLEEEYYVHQDLIFICLNKRLERLDSFQLEALSSATQPSLTNNAPLLVVRALTQNELTTLVKLISEQIYEKSMLSKRGLYEIVDNHLMNGSSSNISSGSNSNTVSSSFSESKMDSRLFNLKHLISLEWFLQFFKCNTQISSITFDPTIFRAIIDLDYCEIIWRFESDYIYERRRKFLKHTTSSKHAASIGDSNHASDNSNDSVVKNERVCHPQPSDVFLSNSNSILSTVSPQMTVECETMETVVETNTRLFPHSTKLMENIHQIVSMFESSQTEKTSQALDISLESIQNVSLSVSSSKVMELYEKVCIQGFIIQSLKKIKHSCIERGYTLNDEQGESFRRQSLANLHMSNSCLKLFFSSSLEMFFNDDLPNTLFTNLKNFDSLKSVYKDELLELIATSSSSSETQ